MEMQEIIRQAESNIRQAVEDYGAHTYQMDVLEDISDEFIERTIPTTTASIFWRIRFWPQRSWRRGMTRLGWT